MCTSEPAGRRASFGVTASGVKTFCVLERIRGAGTERGTLARFPEMTIAQARKKAAKMPEAARLRKREYDVAPDRLVGLGTKGKTGEEGLLAITNLI